MLDLTVKQRQYLKGLAHGLSPVVMIGDKKGLTDGVLKEVDVALTAHELIKIRILGEDREFRKSIIDKLCLTTHSILVQHIGKLLVIYRPGDKGKISLNKIK